MARCTVERLMAAQGWTGALRGKQHRTTIPAPSDPRLVDLVDRDFTATAPNQLRLADFPYVATFSGVVYVAFVFRRVTPPQSRPLGGQPPSHQCHLDTWDLLSEVMAERGDQPVHPWDGHAE